MGEETSVSPWRIFLSVQTAARWLVSLSGFDSLGLITFGKCRKIRLFHPYSSQRSGKPEVAGSTRITHRQRRRISSALALWAQWCKEQPLIRFSNQKLMPGWALRCIISFVCPKPTQHKPCGHEDAFAKRERIKPERTASICKNMAQGFVVVTADSHWSQISVVATTKIWCVFSGDRLEDIKR